MQRYKPTESEIESFIRGMWEMYSFINRSNPNAVIFPLRGAYPFKLAYDSLANLNQDANIPDQILLPIGTIRDNKNKTERGLSRLEKIKITKGILKDYFEKNNKKIISKIILVDEVISGGTIIKHFHILKKLLETHLSRIKLEVCAIQDGKSHKMRKYTKQSREYNFRKINVEYLFTADRQKYLPVIVREEKILRVETDIGGLEEILRKLERHRFLLIQIYKSTKAQFKQKAL